MPYRCWDCRGHFSIKHGTVMQSSKIGLQNWAIAIYLMATGIKGTSSMKVYRDLGMRRATAWFMIQRICEAFDAGDGLPLQGPVEADKIYIGGKRRDMSLSERKALKDAGRGPVGNEEVVGVKERKTNQVRATVVPVTGSTLVARFVAAQTNLGAKVFTDETKVYNALKPWYDYEVVNHSVSEYIRRMAHANGMESFRALLKRAYHGTFHHMSPQHLHRYVNEFAGRHNIRDFDTIAQMTALERGMVGKRLRYRDLIADNVISSGVRS